MLLASAWWLGEHEQAPTQHRIADHAGTDVEATDAEFSARWDPAAVRSWRV